MSGMKIFVLKAIRVSGTRTDAAACVEGGMQEYFHNSVGWSDTQILKGK